jgi:hypothetical protein
LRSIEDPFHNRLREELARALGRIILVAFIHISVLNVYMNYGNFQPFGEGL